MLQITLSLLGCTISRHLWDLQPTVARVFLGVTSFGVVLYLVIVVPSKAARIGPRLSDTLSGPGRWTYLTLYIHHSSRHWFRNPTDRYFPSTHREGTVDYTRIARNSAIIFVVKSHCVDALRKFTIQLPWRER